MPEPSAPVDNDYFGLRKFISIGSAVGTNGRLRFAKIHRHRKWAKRKKGIDMGKDVSLFVLADRGSVHYPDRFAEHVLRLHRDGSGLWSELLNAVKATGQQWESVYLPHGHRAAKATPYGGPLMSVKGKTLDPSDMDIDAFVNVLILRFVAESFPERDVVIFWW